MTLLQRLQTWPARRQPPQAGDRRLARGRVYLLPTRAGLGALASLVLMTVVSVNYGLSLGLALCALVTGLYVAALLQTAGNLHGLVLRPGRVDPAHAGERALLHVAVRNDARAPRRALALRVVDGGEAQALDLAPGAERTLTLAVPAPRRGRLAPPMVVMSTAWPLGLWRAWLPWRPAVDGWVWPALENPAVPLPATAAAAQVAGGEAGRTGDDEIATLREGREHDGPNRIAWRAMARSGRDTLLVKEFAPESRGELLLDWRDLPAGLDDEARLSRLTRWTTEADRAGLRYALRLPGVVLEAGGGPVHRARCLEALARHGETP